MELRLLVAYFLIGAFLMAALLLIRRRVIKGREHRRLMRGHGSYKVASRR